MRPEIALLAAAARAYDTVHALLCCDDCGATWETDDDACRWCAARRQAQARAVLRPPAPRGYGFATTEDLAGLGIDPVAEREVDLRAWARDLEMAVAAGVVTEHEARCAWDSRTN